jgi:hypothetical protein
MTVSLNKRWIKINLPLCILLSVCSSRGTVTVISLDTSESEFLATRTDCFTLEEGASETIWTAGQVVLRSGQEVMENRKFMSVPAIKKEPIP